MRRIALAVIGFLLAIAPLSSALASSNPIPGVGIVVKRNPGSSTALVVPSGFFGAGSSAFSGTVSLEGSSSHSCGGCDNGGASFDSRLDFDHPPGSSVLSATMPAFTLYSSSPIQVSIGGALRALHVAVSVTGRDPLLGTSLAGEFSLASGSSLPLGSSAELSSGSLRLTATARFSDATTGQVVGGSLAQDLDLHLSSLQPVSISRVADGTPTGHLVLGRAASGALSVVSLSSAGNELVLNMLSLDSSSPPVRAGGLLCTGTGLATVDSPDKRRLVVSNIGSSGQDGVDLSLHGMQGHVLSSTDLCPSPPGASLRLSASGPLRVVTWVSVVEMTRTPTGGIDVSCDGSRLHSSITAARQDMLYLAGGLERTVTSSSSTPRSFSISSATGPVSVTQSSFEVLPEFDVAVTTLWLSSGAVVTLDGQSTPCDRIVLTEDCDDGNDFMETMSVRVALPPGSPVSSLSFDSQSVVSHGTRLSVGDLDMDGLEDFVALSSVSNAAGSRGVVSVSRAPSAEVLDVSGGGGGSGGALSRGPRQTVSQDGSFARMSLSPVAPFLLDPATDAGASIECFVTSPQACSSDQVAGSLSLSATSNVPGSLRLSGRFSGMCADGATVRVRLHDHFETGDIPTQSDFSDIRVSAPPGGPSSTPVVQCGPPVSKSSSNIQNNLKPGEKGFSSAIGADGLSLHYKFASPRVFCIGSQCVTGDEIVVTGTCSSGACASGGVPLTITGSNFAFTSRSASSSSSAPLGVARFSAQSTDPIFAQVSPGVAITPAKPVMHIPVLFDRSSTSAARGTSVTFHLSSNLVLASPVVEGDYFSRSGQTEQLVVTNPDGSFTVDCALLGAGCGPTDSGVLFVVDVARAPGVPDGVASISVDACEAAACDGSSLPANPGGVAFFELDSQAPTAITDLSAVQVKSGNDADGTTRVSLVWSPRSNVDESVAIYRASFGNYPLYSRGSAPGSVPPPPSSSPPSGRWSSASTSLVAVCDATGTCAVFDEPSSRDVFYYVAVVRDRAGNESPSSNMTTGTLDYHLGDVAGGASGTVCSGDNAVSSVDISALGSLYGSSVSTSSAATCFDVGPTFTGTVDSRPVPDGRLSFRDLIIYAINYSLVSLPASRPVLASEPANTLSLQIPEAPEPGRTFEVKLDLAGAGDALGVSTQLAWDPAVVEPVGVTAGDLADQQGRQAVVLSAEPGNVDAALLGVGAGFAGRGTLARVTFRVKASGDPAIRIASVEGRDTKAEPVAFTGFSVPPAVGRTALRLAFPNPFAQQTTIAFALAKAGVANVGVYDITGRQVRVLVDGVQPAGERLVQWDGRDDHGNAMGAGVYLVRLKTHGQMETRAVRLVK